MRILMVCLGNICRSPLAEGILLNRIEKYNLDWKVDSAGTSSYHAGSLPDPRSITIAEKNGIDITYQRSRHFTVEDFDKFDLILTMDSSNYQNVKKLATNTTDINKIDLIMNYANPGRNIKVPDPYWGELGFEKVFGMLEKAVEGMLKRYVEEL